MCAKIKLLIRYVNLNSYVADDNLWQHLQFCCYWINFERKENKFDMWVLLNYDFKLRLNQKECLWQIKLEFGNKASSSATVFRWFTEFCRSQNCLLIFVKNTQENLYQLYSQKMCWPYKTLHLPNETEGT